MSNVRIGDFVQGKKKIKISDNLKNIFAVMQKNSVALFIVGTYLCDNECTLL